MEKIQLSKFQDFVDSYLIKEGVQTDEAAWDQYFTDMGKTKADAGSTTGENNTLPAWAETGLKLDTLKGKTADERWDWLKTRVDTVLKDKQVSKVEDIKADKMGGIPGYRLLWKEDKTETGDQQEKSGPPIKVYFTEIYKGSPGTWEDRKNEGGTPGSTLGKGYWGQNSRVPQPAPGSTGATGTAAGVDGGILWVDQPEVPAASAGSTGGIGDIKLIDLFAETAIGKAVLGFLMGDKGFEEWLKTNKIESTDSPATTAQLDAELTAEQKETQQKNIDKLKAMGHKTVKPDFPLFTSSSDYSYKPDSLKMTWDQIKSGLDKAGASKQLDFSKWNLVGIRNTMAVKNKFSNRFTDLIVLMSPEKDKKVQIYPATTTPGPAMMFQPFRRWWMASALKSVINPKGLAVLQPGVYKYKIGKHLGKYTALVGASTTVGRIPPVEDGSDVKFTTFSPSEKETGESGINIHKSGANTPAINDWSAGCQVLKKSDEFNELMDTVQKAGQGDFEYALINSSDLGGTQQSPLA